MKRYLVWCLLFAAPLFAQRSSTPLTAANQCAQVGLDSTRSSTVVIDVSGTFSATLQPQVAINGQSARNTQVTPSTSQTPQSTITAAGGYQALQIAGYDLFQVCATSYTSGTATVVLSVSTGPVGTLGGGGTGAVASVFGRTGAVVATSGDYSFSLISGTPSTTQVPFQSLTTTGNSGAATLGSGVLNIPQYTGAVASVFGRTGAVTATSGDYTAAQVTNAAATNSTNVFTGLQDFSGGTMEIPESAAFVSTVDSTIGIDTNTGIAHFWGPGSADAFNVVTSSTSTTATQVLHATATAGLYTPSAIVAGDLPTTLTSGTAITNAALTTPTLGTPASGTLTNATGLPMNGVVGATAANTITETAVLRPTTFAGVETANLTYPYVFQNTNSTNSNTSGALLVNCAGTDSGPTCFMVNGPAVTGTLASFVTGGTVTNGVISGQTQVWGITGQGAVTEANSFTVSAGVVTVPAGSTTASLAFAGDTAGAGLYRPAAAVYGITNGTNEVLRLQATGIKGTSGGGYGFTASSSSSTGAFDTCQSRSAAGVLLANSDSACGNGLGSYKAQAYLTNTNCTSSASPAVCAAAAAGSVAVPTGTNPTLVVNTTAVTANSQIFVQSDDSLGTKLSVTCNTTLANLAVEPVVSARTAATNFTITISGTVVTNPICLSYFIVN